MKKPIYRKMPVNQFQPSSISRDDVGARLVVAVDVAKVDMVAAIAAGDGRVLNTIAWKAPTENAAMLDVLRSFRAAGFLVEVGETVGPHSRRRSGAGRWENHGGG